MSPQARALGVGMLVVLGEHNLDGVLAFLPQLADMAKQDKWWEVQVRRLVKQTGKEMESGSSIGAGTQRGSGSCGVQPPPPRCRQI